MGATPSHENDGDDVAGTDSDDDDDIIKIQPNARYRVSKTQINLILTFPIHFWTDSAIVCACYSVQKDQAMIYHCFIK